jgi:uncharacterized tellurite resistance protein B-like protein
MALTDSQVALWQTIVSLVHADGKVHPEEDKFLRERFEHLSMTPEQKEQLLSQIEKAEEPRELFKKISEPRDRSLLIYFARLLFHSDGELCDQEKRILELLESDVMDKVDMVETMHKVDQIVNDYEEKERARREVLPIHRKIINAITFWDDYEDWRF